MKKLTKATAGALLAVSVLALNPIGASAEWKQDNRGWWYSEDDSWATRLEKYFWKVVLF